MQFLPFLLVFIAGSLTTVALDIAAGKMRRARINKGMRQRALMVQRLEAEGWQRPWLS